jgi:hypothetical protein
VLFDDSINVKPRYAIYIINISIGGPFHYSYDDVLQVLKLPASAITAKARFGSWWISGQPSLDQKEMNALVKTGAGTLVVDLIKGGVRLK